MAHECPDCGQACYCDGDIEDGSYGTAECVCCLGEYEYSDDDVVDQCEGGPA